MKIFPLILLISLSFIVQQAQAQTRVAVDIVKLRMVEDLVNSARASVYTADNRVFGQTYVSPYLTDSRTCDPCQPPQTFTTNNFGSTRIATGSSTTIIRFYASSFVSDNIFIPVRMLWKKTIPRFYGNAKWVGKIEIETGIPGSQTIFYDNDVVLEGSYLADFYNTFPNNGRKELFFKSITYELNDLQ
jgi:hypothetical protein